jgi:acyl carrier protein
MIFCKAARPVSYNPAQPAAANFFRTRMVDPEALRQRLAEYIANEILQDPGRDIGWDEPLISSGMIDSFHLVDIALFVEDAFRVHIEDSELNADSFDNIFQLSEIVMSRQAWEEG